MALNPAIISGGLKILGGLFGGRKKDTTQGSTRNGIMGQAQGARDAAAQYGFNPLTLLQNSAPVFSQSGPPPLASAAILAADVIDENFSEEAKERKKYNKLATDLLQIQVEQARGAVYQAPPPSALSAVGGGTPALNGGRTSTYGEAPFLNEVDRGEARVDERDNTVSMQSHGQETVVPVGPGIDEVLTGLVIGANNRAKARDALRENHTVGVPLRIPPSLFGVNRIGEIMPPKPDPEVDAISNRMFWNEFIKTEGWKK